MTQRWPDTLWLVRHGESAGNVARDAAYAAGLSVIDIAQRDVDVPLSSAGEKQADALGHWYAGMAPTQRPSVVLVSPYLRARHTAALIEAAGGVEPSAPILVDERLREKECGILDRLTTTGYAGGTVGLATSGSGDTLAGIVAGFAARGAPALLAASWAVFLHGSAGRALEKRMGTVGFLARELLDEVPRLMRGLAR